MRSMKSHLPKRSHFLAVSILAAVLAGVGCRKPTDAGGEMEKAAAAFQAPAEQSQPATTPSLNQGQPADSPKTVRPGEELSQAMTAYKQGQLEDAVVRLQRLRATPVMSPQQRIAINDAIAAVMGEVYVMAERGDARAVQAVKAYNQMQNRSR